MDDNVPECAAVMGCLCASHARGTDPSYPCDTYELGYMCNAGMDAGCECEWRGYGECPECGGLHTERA